MTLILDNQPVRETTFEQYLKDCGGKDRFEFWTPSGDQDVEGATKFRDLMLKRMARECVTQSYNVVWIKLQAVRA